jgi:hypothetical protein
MFEKYKTFKIMKHINLILRTSICLSLVLSSIIALGQDKRLYVEVKDTIEVAYYTYYTGEWERSGFSSLPVIEKDSIGVDSIRITKLFYIEEYDPYVGIRAKSDTILPYAIRKIYLQFQQKEYINGCSSYSSSIDGL